MTKCENDEMATLIEEQGAASTKL